MDRCKGAQRYQMLRYRTACAVSSHAAPIAGMAAAVTRESLEMAVGAVIQLAGSPPNDAPFGAPGFAPTPLLPLLLGA
jgi:hypothetical protein